MAQDRHDKQHDDDRPIKVAVLGGSGFIGSYVVMNLLHMGCYVNLLINRRDPDYVSPRGRLKTFTGRIEDSEALEACFEGCEFVYHLIGLIAETRDKTFKGTVIDGTAKVVAAAKKAGVRKIFFLSALGTSDNAESLYFYAKNEAEKLVRQSGLDYTIFRPSVVYGVGDQFVNRIAKMVRRAPLVPVLGDGLYKIQPVYVEELAAVMVMSLRREQTNGQTYEIAGPDQLTYLEFIDIIKRVLNVDKGKIHIPMGMVKLAACVLGTFMKPAPITVDQLKMMQAGSTCDHTVAERAFDVKFSGFEGQLFKYMRTKHG